jgi:hypothetical protein
LEEGFAASGGVCRRVKNTSRIPFAIETSLRARVLEYRYITPSIRSTPECALSHAARMMLLMGMLRKRRGKMRVSRWRRGRKIGKPKKLERFDDEALGCRRSRVLSIDRWRNALGERGSRRVRARGSFVRAGRDATSVDMTHSGRSLTRNPKLIVPGGLDRARPREDDLSRRGIVRGVECD